MMFGLFGIAILIAILSVVQSIFGMGLLVFGTPTLLLLGFGFAETLCMLLPSSIAISALQILLSNRGSPDTTSYLFAVSIPATVVFLSLSVSNELTDITILLVAIALLASALVGLNSKIKTRFEKLLRCNLGLYHFVMGMLHGATNLGGPMLAILAVTLHQGKEEIRRTVAYYYFFLANIQCVTLLVTGNGDLLLQGIFLVPVAILTFFVAGKRAYERIKNRGYQNSINCLIFIYGLVLIVRVGI